MILLIILFPIVVDYSKKIFNIFFYSLIGVDSASQVSGARQIIRRYFEITNQNKNKT